MRTDDVKPLELGLNNFPRAVFVPGLGKYVGIYVATSCFYRKVWALLRDGSGRVVLAHW